MQKLARSEPAEANPRARRPEPARVWDPLVRLFHWSLVASFAVAWLTSHSWEGLHHWAGYAAAALVLLRIPWGVIGTRYARFSQFVCGPGRTVGYLSTIVQGRETRYLGHNPAGGAMILALMAAMVATALTGWMMTTDTYFGVSWVERAHSLAAHGLLALVLLHLAGVILASRRHRENLALAMITGRKRAAAEGDVA